MFPLLVYPLFGLTVAIVLLAPRLTTAVPAPLIAIVVVTAIVIAGHLSVPNVGGEGTMTPGLPSITPFTVPLNWETLCGRRRSASPSSDYWRRF